MTTVGTNYETKADPKPVRTRTQMFIDWLMDLTPEKVALLADLESKARLFSAMSSLVTDPDPKHVKAMIAASDKLRMEYEDAQDRSG